MTTITLRADFAEDVVFSYSGGVNELEIGACCTTKEAGEGLAQKIDAALDLFDGSTPDIVLSLTDDEAMCLAVASQNCATESLAPAQRHRIQEWFERWRQSDFARTTEEVPTP